THAGGWMSAREDLHQLVDALPEDVLLRVTGSVSEPNDERQLRQIARLVEKAAAPDGGTLRQRGGRLVPAPWKSRHRLAARPPRARRGGGANPAARQRGDNAAAPRLAPRAPPCHAARNTAGSRRWTTGAAASSCRAQA